MGQSSSKQKHYPFPVPTYPAGYGPPPPFVPPQQYPQPVPYPTGYPQGPYGYVPPVYGQPNTLPPPLLNWLPQDKPKRKHKTTKRANSEQYPTGYVPSESQHRHASTRTRSMPRPVSTQPQGGPVIPGQNTQSYHPTSHSHRPPSQSQPPPLFTPGAGATGAPLTSFPSPQVSPRVAQNPRRAATPFLAPFSNSFSDEEDDDLPQDHRETSQSHHANPVMPPPGQVHSTTQQHQPPSRREPIQYPPPRPIQAELSHVIQPMSPAESSAFGPPDPGPRAPIANPLPPPPRDLYEMTPYKSLLALPQSTALLTATYGAQPPTQTMPTSLLTATYGAQPPTQTMPSLVSGAPATQTQPKRKKGGLFRAFSSRRHSTSNSNADSLPQRTTVQYIPVFVPQQPGQASATATGASGASASTSNLGHGGFNHGHGGSNHGHGGSNHGHGGSNHGHGGGGSQNDQSGTSTTASTPVTSTPTSAFGSGFPSSNMTRGFPTGNSTTTGFPSGGTAGFTTAGLASAGLTSAAAGPSSAPNRRSASVASSHRPPSIVRFNQQGTYAGFMNHSAHRVLFKNQTYPSATHLHEAMKYLEHRPDLAENIRNCRDVKEVYPLSARYQQFQRSDWGQVFLQLMEETLFMKFKQHPDLRWLLTGTERAMLIYADPNDSFWGEGNGTGANELGKALMRVRERLERDRLG